MKRIKEITLNSERTVSRIVPYEILDEGETYYIIKRVKESKFEDNIKVLNKNWVYREGMHIDPRLLVYYMYDSEERQDSLTRMEIIELKKVLRDATLSLKKFYSMKEVLDSRIKIVEETIEETKKSIALLELEGGNPNGRSSQINSKKAP